MENSVSSSHYKVITTPEPILEDDSVPEESGWTQYIEDFEAYDKEGCVHENSSSSSSYMSYSMVSDAGSGPEWKHKFSINPAGGCNSFGVLQKIPKKLNFKKKIPFDDSLEDTASSPVNSPKGNEISIDEHMEYNNINREHDFKDVDCIDLKQKGLCVVPVSMVVNYLG
ncbi:uncharacterized protein LOC110740296 [Chenopodium quinoa]|uniref:Uncharacterized protein n=1 Tax=Chenopodium quinoa TaxID=63459 RepID=A0A803MY55_CHEQI|nr:uncharacterized protein LOC110740296 [Chenopodium quinoa]